RGRGWGGATGGGGYGFEGKDYRMPRDARSFEQERKARPAPVAAAAAPAGGNWAQRNKPVAQEQPEICAAVAGAPAAPPADGVTVPGDVSNGWPGVANASGDAQRNGARHDQSDGNQRPAPAVVLPKQGGGWEASGGSTSTVASAPAPAAAPAAAAPQPAPPLVSGDGGGSPVAPEEELPEAAPAPVDAAEGAAAGGVVNNAGEFSGGEKVAGAGGEARGA
ncbi:unnamed protein product, partial [Scytosiphon promiscuus]